MTTQSDPDTSVRRSAAPSRTAIVYLRVSSQEQGRSGLGIEAQRLAVLRFCAQRGWDIKQEYVEVQSSFRAIKGRLSRSTPAHEKVSPEIDRVLPEDTYVPVVLPGNAITYCRVSTHNQTTAGYSLEAQSSLIDRFCREHGLNVVARYVETERAWRRIAATLNAKSLRTQRGTPWSDVSVQNLLRRLGLAPLHQPRRPPTSG